MHRLYTFILSILAALGTCGAFDRAGFMADQDMTWERLPSQWYEAPFLGNGSMGTYICREPGTNAIRVDIGNSLVEDHRPDDRSIYGQGRLLIGHFLLEPTGDITGGDMRLDLWNATATATIATARGEIKLKAWVATDAPYIVVDTEASEGERDFRWTFVPAKADSPRQLNAIARNSQKQIKKDYVSNPDPTLTENTDGGVCDQPLLAGGGSVTAWRILGSDVRRTLAVTSAYARDGKSPVEKAGADIAAVSPAMLQAMYGRHTEWWHAFYRQSFVSIPDKKLENFYWAQIYKIGSATRQGGAIADNCGPWLVPTPWPAAWWNLNVQLSYWPVYTSNHTELGRVLADAVAAGAPNLVQNVPARYRHDSAGLPVCTGSDLLGSQVGVPGSGGKAQVGNLTWLCHNLWLQYRYTMDTDMLRSTLFPTLRRAINYYLHFLEEGDDGRLHLPSTYSPEYGSAPDCNYDLALLRWGCGTLLESARILGIDDPLIPRWREVTERLADYPEAPAQGMMIGAGLPYEKSHRHFSHLMMFYPLHTLNADMPGARELMERSTEHWLGIKGNILGFSHTGASLLYSAFGMGDKALEHLHGLFGKHVRPNTMYKESGPVLETPLSGAQCINEMLLQSWGGKLRVFPAMPSEWADAAFTDLRGEGAFLVSAVRRGGRTVAVTVRSLAGEPCTVHTDMADPRVVAGTATLTRIADGEYSINLRKGESVTFTPGGIAAEEPTPVAGDGRNFFGLKAM